MSIELTGEYRAIQEGDWYISNLGGRAVYQGIDPSGEHVWWILTPDRPPAPEGYEYTEEFRPASAGDYFMSAHGQGLAGPGQPVGYRGSNGSARWILRKVNDPKDWWPKWLKAGWAAKDEGNFWYAFKRLPTRQSSFWETNDNAWLLDPAFCGIQFPDVPWEESLFKNPWNEQ